MLSKSDQILNFLHTNVQILSNWIVCGTIQQFIYSNIQNFLFKFYLRTKRDKMFVTPCYWQLIKLSVFCKVNGAIVCTEKGLECPPYVGSFRQGVPPTWFSTLSALWSQTYNQTHSSDWKIFWRFIEFIVHPLYKSLFYLLAA